MDNSYGFLQLPCVSYLDRFRHWTYDVIFSGQCNPTDSHSKINFTFFFYHCLLPITDLSAVRKATLFSRLDFH